MSVALELLDEAIRQNADRLTELNNKIQAVSKGGTREVSRHAEVWLKRTRIKRDNAEWLHRVLRVARKDLRTQTEAVRVLEAWFNDPCVVYVPDAADVISLALS